MRARPGLEKMTGSLSEDWRGQTIETVCVDATRRGDLQPSVQMTRDNVSSSKVGWRRCQRKGHTCIHAQRADMDMCTRVCMTNAYPLVFV